MWCYLKATSVLAACLNSTQTFTPRLWFRFMVCVRAENQNKSACSCNEKGKKMWKAKDLLAGKRVIYSWPLDSPFQMLDHVKQSINITCAGAFMGPHPLLLICIPQLTQCCNRSWEDSSQAASKMCGKGLISIQETGPTCARTLSTAIKLPCTLFLNVYKSFDNIK